MRPIPNQIFEPPDIFGGSSPRGLNAIVWWVMGGGGGGG